MSAILDFLIVTSQGVSYDDENLSRFMSSYFLLKLTVMALIKIKK